MGKKSTRTCYEQRECLCKTFRQNSGKIIFLVREHHWRRWGPHFSEGLLIAFKFIRKLLKPLSGMLISFQKTVGYKVSYTQKVVSQSKCRTHFPPYIYPPLPSRLPPQQCFPCFQMSAPVTSSISFSLVQVKIKRSFLKSLISVFYTRALPLFQACF